jgi:hypothetical protein
MSTTLKRVGRPMKPPTPGKRATLSLMVSPKVKQRIDGAARAEGRSQSQEAERRIEMSYSYERALGEYQTALARLNQMLGQMKQGNTEQILRELGFQRVIGVGGSAWFEPGVNPARWVVDNANREVIEEMLERAATRGAVKALQGRGS